MSDEGTRSYYDEFSKSYERERARGYHALIDELEFSIVEPYARGAQVLEAGCGTGLILERLHRVAKSAWGFDLSPGMAEKAKERGLQVKLGSVTEIPFENDSFDLVCSFKVLAHVPDIERAMSELVRVTKPGGHLALEFYNPYSLRYVSKKLAGPQPIGEGRTEADVFTRWDSPAALRALLPANTEFIDFKGVRVATPAAFVHKMPGIRNAFWNAEWALKDSPLRKLGGFLVLLARKRS